MNPTRRYLIAIWLLAAMVAGTLMAEAPAVIAPRSFTDNRGRTIVATVVSIDLKTVVLKREADKRDFTLFIADLSEADQVFLAENRAALGTATTGGGVTPLAKRTVTGTEVAKAKRFAKEVLMSDRSGGSATVFRWSERPKFNLKSSDAALAAFGQKVYDQFCDAAGFVEPPAKGADIFLCIGPFSEMERLKQKLAPGANRGGTWTWHYGWEKGHYVGCVFLVPSDGEETLNRRQIFRGIAALFGFPGTSDEFADSAFYTESDASELGPIDRQLVRLVYTQLQDRSSKDKLLLAVEKNWAAMVATPSSTPAPVAKP